MAKNGEERKMRKSVSVVCAFVLFFLITAAAWGQTWYKGQTHLHTWNSDGDAPPDEVVRWYKEHNYDFIVITDHNYLTRADYYDADPCDNFILIQGEEITDTFGETPVHLNGINIKKYVAPQGGAGIPEVLQRNTDAILAAGGIVQINHPNWLWSFGAEEMKKVRGAVLFELWNVTKTSNNFGGGGHPSMEAIWDDLLSAGMVIYGTFTDDMHTMRGEYSWDYANPGRGWIIVRAGELTPDAVTDALSRGEFYATNGVELEDYHVHDERMVIILPENENRGYRIFFIGRGGKILHETEENPAIYNFTRAEMYVRAKIVSSDGETAFTQPYFSPYYVE